MKKLTRIRCEGTHQTATEPRRLAIMQLHHPDAGNVVTIHTGARDGDKASPAEIRANLLHRGRVIARRARVA